MFKAELNDSEFWPTWRLVGSLTLREAAWLLAGSDPANAEVADVNPSSQFKAISTALLEAVEAKVLPVSMGLSNEGRVRWERVEGDSLSCVASRVDLAAWADENGIEHHWVSTPAKGALVDVESFPAELKIAIEAHTAVRAMKRFKKTPKGALLAWLAENHPTLSAGERSRIAIVANWKKGGPEDSSDD